MSIVGVHFKAIKPAPLKEAAMNAYVRSRMKDMGVSMKQDFDRVTSGWSGERPVWEITYRANATTISVSVRLRNSSALGGKKWIWLDQGTKPHVIRPKPGNRIKRLVFKGGYSAGSRSGSLRTFRGKSSGKTVFAGEVHHPGNQPRGWTKMLYQEWERIFERYAKGVISEAVRMSGHAFR